MKRILSIILLSCCSILAQSEVLTNSEIIEMTKAGLGQIVILSKIKSSNCQFDSSSKSLIELKKAGVEDDVISEIIEKSQKQRNRIAQTEPTAKEFVNYSESQSGLNSDEIRVKTPLEILQTAKTVAIKKSSINPARQNLEKALLNREEWRKFNLTLTEYSANADLFIEIGFVPMTLITHRYVYRIADAKTGVIIAAGETTSWGSLADNLAKHIIASLKKIEP